MSCGCKQFTCRGTSVPGCRRKAVIDEEELEAAKVAAIHRKQQENVVDMISNRATGEAVPRRKRLEVITVKKAEGRRGVESPLRIQDNGTSVGAYVVDGKVVRVDGKPHHP